jgi:type IV pilus assembly protein PilM
MLFHKQSLGMEISSAGLKMVVAGGKRDYPRLDSFSTCAFSAETQHFSFKELNILDTARFTSKVRDTHVKLLTKLNRVSLSLPDVVGRVMILNLETRFKNREEGADVIRWKLKKSFPIDIDSVHLDYQVLRENEAGGMVTLVSLISAQVVNQYETLLLESGLEPNKIDLTTFNLFRLFSKRLELAENSAVICFFEGRVSISIFNEGILEFYRAKDIPTGEFEADRVFREINSSLLVYKNNHPGHSFNEVFCATTTQTGKDFIALVAETTGLEPTPLYAGDFVARKEGISCDVMTLQNLAPALGAAMRNL